MIIAFHFAVTKTPHNHRIWRFFLTFPIEMTLSLSISKRFVYFLKNEIDKNKLEKIPKHYLARIILLVDDLSMHFNL